MSQLTPRPIDPQVSIGHVHLKVADLDRPWDVRGAIAGRDEELGALDLEALDQMAALSSGTVPDFEQVRRLYESDARWRVPAVIQSFTPGGLVEVDLEGLQRSG